MGSEIKESTFQILNHFYWNTSEYKNNGKNGKWNAEGVARGLFEKRYHHGRNRHNQKYLNGGERRAQVKGKSILKYQIEVDDLEEEDIRKICDVYWMDYICLPFPVPDACNITELLLRH